MCMVTVQHSVQMYTRQSMTTNIHTSTVGLKLFLVVEFGLCVCVCVCVCRSRLLILYWTHLLDQASVLSSVIQSFIYLFLPM